MVTRIVRLEFVEGKINEFEAIFEKSKNRIRDFDGCEYLSLHKDKQHNNVYYTLSKWQSEEHLNLYRNSQLFKETWAKTKVLFSDKPQAFSLEKITELI